MDEALAARAVKTAFGLLLRDVGGSDAASAALGYPKSHLSEAASHHHADRGARCDHALVLEAIAGRPRVTEAMACVGGYTLLPIPGAHGVPGAALAEVLGGAGELGRRTTLALADGSLTEAERAGLVEQLAALGRAVAHAQAVIAGPAVKLRSVG